DRTRQRHRSRLIAQGGPGSPPRAGTSFPSVKSPPSRIALRRQFQLSIFRSSGAGLPLPFSTRSLRLRRNVAHFMLQWAVNSTASRQFRCPNRTTVYPSSWERPKVTSVPIHSGGPAVTRQATPFVGL